MKKQNGKPNKRAMWMLAGISLTLTACGGGGGSSGLPAGFATSTTTPTTTPTTTTPTTTTPVATQRVTGTLLAPETVGATNAKSLATIQDKADAVLEATDPSCTSVPTGYTPITNAAVTFIDSAGALVNGAAVTDICGRFDATIPATAVTVKFAEANGYQGLSTAISALADRDGDGAIDPVSTFPTGAKIEIAGAAVFGDRLTFIVRDTVTGKAVLGIPGAAVAATSGSTVLPISQFSYVASASLPASVSLVLDASGSMSSTAASGSTLTRYQVAAAAAKLFVNRINTSDRVGTVVFDSTADFLNLAFFTTGWTGKFTDPAGAVVPQAFTADGFYTDKTVLNRLIDFYNPSSDPWKLATAPVRFTGRSYPWGGSTALWDAGSLGIDKVVTQPGRRFVVAMTDGEDNASKTTVGALTTKAVGAKVPVFTVGIGSATSVNVTPMQNLSKATGGTFTLVPDGDVQARLAGAFESIRTGIQFQYGATLGGITAAGTAVRVQINYAGLQTEASLVSN